MAPLVLSIRHVSPRFRKAGTNLRLVSSMGITGSLVPWEMKTRGRPRASRGCIRPGRERRDVAEDVAGADSERQGVRRAVGESGDAHAAPIDGPAIDGVPQRTRGELEIGPPAAKHRIPAALIARVRCKHHDAVFVGERKPRGRAGRRAAGAMEQQQERGSRAGAVARRHIDEAVAMRLESERVSSFLRAPGLGASFGGQVPAAARPRRRGIPAC